MRDDPTIINGEAVARGLAADLARVVAYARELEGDAWGEGGAGMLYSVDQMRALYGVADLMDADTPQPPGASGPMRG